MSWIAEFLADFIGQMAIFKGHDIGRRRAEAKPRTSVRDEYELVTRYPDEQAKQTEEAERPPT